MTEAEWLECGDPKAMLTFLQKDNEACKRIDYATRERKNLLFTIACLRALWHLLPDKRSRHAVEEMEKWEGQFQLSPEDLRAAEEAVWSSENMAARILARVIVEFARDAALGWVFMYNREIELERLRQHREYPQRCARESIKALALAVGESERARAMEKGRQLQTRLLRDCFGPFPFRTVFLDTTWRTATVIALAQSSYENRAFERLPILADSLEEAGCTDAAILDHLRGPSQHVRGCWVVDLLLGKQ